MKSLNWSNIIVKPRIKEKVFPYSSIDKRLQRKIQMDSLLFLTSALSSIYIGLRGDAFFVFMGLLLLLAGLLFVYRIYYLATRNLITEVVGVITNIEKGGYRRQRKYLHVQDVEGTCYRIEVSGSRKKFRLANTISFFIKDNSLGEYIDGEYHVYSPILVAINNATVTDANNQ